MREHTLVHTLALHYFYTAVPTFYFIFRIVYNSYSERMVFTMRYACITVVGLAVIGSITYLAKEAMKYVIK